MNITDENSKNGDRSSVVSSANAKLKILLVYSNTPMDNLMPVSVSTLSGALRQKGFSNIKLFDTTYYPLDK